MIGSGIFLVSSDMSRQLGSPGWLLLAWFVTGLITLTAALSYGELAGMMPKAGGQYVYIRRAFGAMTSFVYGWSVFTVIQSGVIAAVAMAFANYSSVLFPALGGDQVLLNLAGFKISAAQGVAIGSILLLTWLNTLGIEEGKWIQRIFTTAKLLALFGLIAAGIYWIFKGQMWAENWKLGFQSFSSPKEGINWQALGTWATITAFGTALIGSLFSSDAWNNVTFIAGEIKDPSRNIPRSLFLGTLLVTLVYILANVAYLALLPLQANDLNGLSISHAANDRVGAAAAAEILGDSGVWIMAILIMVSTFGCNNGLILAGARLYEAMAVDGLFFKGASKLNRHAVPANALWAQAAWASLLCLSGSYGNLLDYCTFASLVFYIITVAGIFRLRKLEPDTPRPYKALGYPLIPALYILLAGAICLDLLVFKTTYTLRGLLIVLAGVPVYWLITRKKG
ncbi:MAG: amino acid permease [Bacteroidetes bacterium]|nr:amino acid permease [Bacteroidota bacterium]